MEKQRKRIPNKYPKIFLLAIVCTAGWVLFLVSGKKEGSPGQQIEPKNKVVHHQAQPLADDSRRERPEAPPVPHPVAVEDLMKGDLTGQSSQWIPPPKDLPPPPPVPDIAAVMQGDLTGQSSQWIPPPKDLPPPPPVPGIAAVMQGDLTGQSSQWIPPPKDLPPPPPLPPLPSPAN